MLFNLDPKPFFISDRINRMNRIFARRPEAAGQYPITFGEKTNSVEKEDLTHKVIGCAYQVYNKLGFGFLESVYRKAMVIEIEASGLRIKQECPLKVLYREKVVGDFFADLVIEDELIVELKCVERLDKIHEAQLVNYLVATGMNIGLLINFGSKGIDVKRKYRKPVMDSSGRSSGAGRKDHVNPVNPVG